MGKGGPGLLLTKAQAKNDLRAVLAEYNAIITRHPPVMRHYFTERHKSPTAWFTMRVELYPEASLRRPSSDTSLDSGTDIRPIFSWTTLLVQWSHIDLGIAFDQGKLLRVPERVPFRMTPDMVDGMGIAGTNGVFQRCAEETLRVLREGSDVIMTILEVFRYDPLHTWTMSDYKVKAAQPTDSNPNGNSTRADQMHKPLMGDRN